MVHTAAELVQLLLKYRSEYKYYFCGKLVRCFSHLWMRHHQMVWLTRKLRQGNGKNEDHLLSVEIYDWCLSWKGGLRSSPCLIWFLPKVNVLWQQSKPKMSPVYLTFPLGYFCQNAGLALCIILEKKKKGLFLILWKWYNPCPIIDICL